MTDNDKELLTLAARAAGLEVYKPTESGGALVADANRMVYFWNPRGQDGDSRRLQVDLLMDLRMYPKWCEAMAFGANANLLGSSGRQDYGAQHNNDKAAAAREAVFQVAVEIGRRMAG